MRFRSAVAAVAAVLSAASLSASVTGVVIGPDGAPIANARVALFRPIPQMLALRELSRDRKPVPIASAATDQYGRFVLDGGSTGLVDVHVVAEGFAPADAIVATDEQAGTIALRRAALVTGRITANGKPVAGAFVLAVPREGIPESAITDADGRYRLPDPAVWVQMVVVRHPDFAPAAHVGNALDFVLDAGQSLQGRVVDSNGRPVADSMVDVDDLLTAKSGADGAFIIPHAPKRFGVLRARADAAVTTMGFTSGSPVLHLAPASRISGVVRDAGKRPLSGITVAVVTEGSGELAVTDANGAFAMDRLKRGKYQVTGLGSSRYTMDSAAVDATAGDVKHDMVARRVVPVEGLVSDEDRKPVNGAAVVFLLEIVGITDLGYLPLPPAVTAADGRFQLWQELDPSMKVRIAAIKPGFPPAISDLLDPRKPHADLTIPRGVEIAGIITGPDKKPLSGVSVNPVFGTAPRPGMSAASSLPWATSDDAGLFHGRLTAATKALTFVRKGYVTAQRPVDFSPAMKPLQVALAAVAGIRGHVVNKDGSPAPEVMVTAGEKFTTSGPDGSFIVEELEAGPVEMRFGRAITGLQQKSVTAPADDVKLVLAATRTIAGHVTDATTGAPVGKFTVTASSKPGGFAMPQPFETTSGEFTIDAPEGNVSLTVEAEGYARLKEIAVDAASSAPMTIKLSHGRTLHGHVIDEKGQPIAGVALRAGITFSLADLEAPQTLADGSFEVQGISLDEDTDVAFEKSGYVKLERKLRAGRDDVTLEVTLTNGVTVTGHVLDGAGTPSVGVTVMASSAGYGASSGNATTDESGAFRFEGLSPARYDFIVERNAAGEHAAARDVDVTKTRELTIRMEKGATGTIFGRVDSIPRTRALMRSASSP
jgi:protocatechuate 3,4-dioxygenase beta subunit